MATASASHAGLRHVSRNIGYVVSIALVLWEAARLLTGQAARSEWWILALMVFFLANTWIGNLREAQRQ